MDRLHFQISNGLNFYFPISHNNISKHSIIKWKIKILMIFADPILFGIKSGDLNATRINIQVKYKEYYWYIDTKIFNMMVYFDIIPSNNYINTGIQKYLVKRNL
jgi:hypothetical protein